MYYKLSSSIASVKQSNIQENVVQLLAITMLEEFTRSNNLPKFRSQQFNHFFYKELGNNPAGLTTWPADLRNKLAEELDLEPLVEDKVFVSKRGDTVKVLFKRKLDGQRIETVLMRHKDGRNTVCISCMVGCPVNCSFCATGKMGFGGNLSSTEIVEQVLYFQRKLTQGKLPVISGHDKHEEVSNIVFMGMGEPMLNLVEVEKAIEIFTSPEKMGLSQRRITISTSGYVPQFKKFISNGFKGRVAISLHAPNQELRAKMMPVAKIFSLDSLLDALDEYTSLNNKRVSYEYVLIKGLNDQEVHARQLVELFANRLAHINLIPYNPIAEEKFERSNKSAIHRFSEILKTHGVNHTIRITMGDDVNAACGQLADRENKANQAKKIRL